MADGYPDEIPLISNFYKAVSMQRALATGFAGIYSGEDAKDQGVRIDLTTDTPGKRAIDGMIERAVQAVGESDTLKKLLAKPQWSIMDRKQWELSIADISRDEIFSEPRFGNYRLEKTKPMTPISITEIDKDTNFHCEPMAAISGIMVQRLENHFLQPSEDKLQFKRRTDYYLTGGLVYRSAFQTGKKPVDVLREAQSGETLHAYIVSPITGNYIEGTIGRPQGWEGSAPSTYRPNAIKGYTFNDYLAGYPMLTDDGGFTLGYDGSLKTKELVQKRKEAIAAGDYSVLTTARVDMGKPMEFDPFLVADERNIARVFAPSVALKDGDGFSVAEHMDRVQRVSDLLKARMTKTGRPYTELLQLSKEVDFAVSADEGSQLVIGNRLLLWSKEKPLVERLLNDDDSLIKRGTWKEQELAEFLADRGVSEVWVQRAIPKDAVPTANNFEQIVRAYYDSLPETRLKPKKEEQVSAAARGRTKKKEEDKEEKVEFSDYLEFSKRQYIARKGKPEEINAPGTMVPLLLNPLRQWEINKKLKGRTYATYEKEDVIDDSYTEARIVNRPGVVNDEVFIDATGVINGNGVTRRDMLKIAISESIGELPDPLPTQPKAKAAQRRRP